ncbi:uncharacterized protein [Physcomitrium patens]|uniref:uncharacterized protein isoform X1 n=1 Tax=Physcomitrium patens TaxID=3218 RepID=UPI003CCCB06E
MVANFTLLFRLVRHWCAAQAGRVSDCPAPMQLSSSHLWIFERKNLQGPTNAHLSKDLTNTLHLTSLLARLIQLHNTDNLDCINLNTLDAITDMPVRYNSLEGLEGRKVRIHTWCSLASTTREKDSALSRNTYH